MEDSVQVHPVGNNDVQVEVVTADGQPVTTRPIRVEELLQQQDHTLDVGDGIALRLEELNAQQDYSDDDDDTSSSGSSDIGRDFVGPAASGGHVGAPPGTHATNDWYDVLDALRREQQDVERTAAAVEGSRRKSQEGEGRLVTRNPNSTRSTATPLKRFSNAPSTDTRSVAGDRLPAPAPGASRQDVWASLAPPKDMVPHNYNVLRYVSYMSALDSRRFRPTALAFHAAASYLNRKDRGQRFLVYGGLSFGARKVEQELYEFSVLTGNWRRLEGRQLVPAGHYAHTLTVVEPLDRVVVVGGIGPGGAATPNELKKAWAEDPLRAPRYQALCPLLRHGGGATSLGSGVAAATRAPTASLGIGAAARPASHATAAIGFVSLLFDMSLSDLVWRAIQPAQPFPLAYHTAVHFDKEIFVFGGLTDELRVSGQLLAINPETYAVRLIATAATSSSGGAGSARSRREQRADDDASAAAGPGPRFLHSAVRYGPYMVIYGGYDMHNEVQSDCWAFDMVNERWERLRCRGEAAGRAGHECCVVGCRMLVTGGFECSLEEVGTAAGSAAATPAATVMELNLVPTSQGEYLWRSAVKLHPALPPLAFTRCAPCGEDHSFLLFGGLTQLPRRLRSKSGDGRSTSAKRRAGGSDHDGSDSDAETSKLEGEQQRRQQQPGSDSALAKQTAAADAAGQGHKGLLSRLAPFDDGLVFTFPVRQQHKTRHSDEPMVNALGVEVDPNELPEHFKTFVRRQEDFIKKKDAAVVETMRKTTLEEQEGMEPTLFLTEDEIDLLLQRSEDCCTAFAQRYQMNALPSNVPDREERVHLIEECISESRQVRDVLKSMKGSAPGVTAVKSKTHRKRAGQKFEDYSAAKPFRRVVVMHLIESINAHLARMHHLNKALRTVDWEGKTSFLEAVNDMQDSVHAVSRAVNGVMRKYIQHRVDSLMKGVDKHKEVMRLLTQVVEKNRHDKIWGVEEARDEQRQQNQRARAASAKAGSPLATPAQRKAHSKSPARSALNTAATRTRVLRCRSLGGGYHADESKAVVYLLDKEWSALLARSQAVRRCAAQLQQYCREGMSSAATPASAAASPVVAGQKVGPLSLPVPLSGASPVAPPSLSSPPPVVQPPQLPAQQVSATPAGLSLPAPALPPSLQVQVAAPEVGAARPRDVMIHHSDELRGETAAVAAEVASAAAAFHATLMENDANRTGEQHAGAAASSSSSSSPASPVAGRPLTNVAATAVVDGNPASPLLPSPPPAGAAAAAAGRSASTSSSSSRSSSSGASSLAGAPSPLPAATAVGAAPVPAVPSLSLPVPATVGVVGLPGSTAVVPPRSVKVSSPHPAESEKPATHADSKEQEKRQSDSTHAPSAGHALFLSSLRPLLAAKDALLAYKNKVTLIRKNDWDSNDPAGAPQDAKVEELYRRLVKRITAVAQSVTACFLTKAGARPPRVRRVSISVAAKQPPSRTATSHKAKRAAGSLAATAESARHSPPAAQIAVSGASHGNQPVLDEASGGQALRLKPLSPIAGKGERSHHDGSDTHADDIGNDWLKTSAWRGSGADSKAAEAASPLVPIETLLQDVRLDGASPSLDAAAQVSIQPVFLHTRTVPNRGASIAGVPGTAATGCGAQSASSLQSAVVTLSAAPKVIMPQSTAAVTATAASPAAQRRRSTIEEFTQLPSAASPATHGVQGGLDAGVTVPAREPITSITGGNFAVNTEYLFRAAPYTIPAGLLHSDDAATTAAVAGARHAWANVDDDYFYFGRPVEQRIAAGDMVVAGPPYVAPAPTLAAGQVTVSPAVGSAFGAQRLNVELATAGRPATARRSVSSRPDERYRSTTASQAQKTQTARPLRKAGSNTKSFYTPGELQLMQARERLRAKPQKH
ncbi:Kelch motif containing protein [Lotmaria passim]